MGLESLIFLLLVFLQEQSDETDMQVMRTHTETLLDTLRDIAQVNDYTHALIKISLRCDRLIFIFFF